MTLNISFSKSPQKKSEAAVVCFYQDKEPTTAVASLNYELGGFVNHVLQKSKAFKGGLGQVEIYTLPEGAPYGAVLFLGLGKRADLNKVAAEKAGGKLCAALGARQIKSAELYADNDAPHSDVLAAHMAVGAVLRSYKFEIYKTPKPEGEKEELLEAVNIVLQDAEAAQKVYTEQSCVVQGVFWARDLVNEPPNVLYPEAYAKRIKDMLKPLGVDVEILDDKKMLKLGMGALMAVGQGSARPPFMVIMQWKGDKGNKGAPLAFVGKGVTFDTGGISLKPGPGMEDMKMDMGGSAAVVGLMKSLALRKAKVNVVGIVGLVENMPSDRAYRPADIVTSYAGKTIEVLNTDAEGRLVLADALSYVQDKYKPSLIVDLATLTGAMIVALGHEYCGTFCTDDAMWEQLSRASKATEEKLWRMPLDDLWKKEMEGSFSDIQNVAKSGRDAGSCTAAGFLWHFIKDGTPWAHMDIAGTAWIKGDRDITPKYGTGFGVRLLDRFVADNYEQG
jgi:leucyl aminopeptidase